MRIDVAVRFPVQNKPMYTASGLVPSPFLVRLKEDKLRRRVYEAWDQLQKNGSDDPEHWDPVPYVLVIKGERVVLTDEECAFVEAAEPPLR